MSIIHEALKRKARIESGDTSEPSRGITPRGASSRGAALWQAPWFPGALAAGGVLLAALVTYLATRPGDITVVLPPPASSPAIPAATAPPTPAEAPPYPTEIPPGYAYQPIDPALSPGTASTPAPAPSGAVPGATYSPGTNAYPASAASPPSPAPIAAPPVAPGPVTPPPSAATAPTSEFAHIPVYGALPGITPGTSGYTPASPQTASNPAPAGSGNDLPPNAVTIEMSQGRLESFNGGVSVNSTVPQPGAPLRVGSVVTTQPGAAATLGFENAQVDVAGGSSARVSRLERRTDASGTPREEVTVHLSTGNARTVVRPGGGQVLISTDQLTAAASSGAFQVQSRLDGSVSVQSEGGQVRLVPRAGGEPVTLSNGDRITWRNGTWER